MGFGGPTSPRAACAVLLVLLPACHSARTVSISPGDGQALAQAVADYGSTGEDTTILLPPGRILSVANVTFPDAVPVSVWARASSALQPPHFAVRADRPEARCAAQHVCRPRDAPCLCVACVQVDPSYVPFSSGRLTIMPAPSSDPSTGPTILDAGMRYGMPMFGKLQLTRASRCRVHLS